MSFKVNSLSSFVTLKYSLFFFRMNNWLYWFDSSRSGKIVACFIIAWKYANTIAADQYSGQIMLKKEVFLQVEVSFNYFLWISLFYHYCDSEPTLYSDIPKKLSLLKVLVDLALRFLTWQFNFCRKWFILFFWKRFKSEFSLPDSILLEIDQSSRLIDVYRCQRGICLKL